MEKKLLRAFSLMLAMVLLSSFAAASHLSPSDVHVSRIAAYSVGSEVESVVNVENKMGGKLDGVNVRITLPELGISRRFGPADISAGSEITRRSLVDLYSAGPGEYYVRITVSNDHARRVKHRIITIP